MRTILLYSCFFGLTISGIGQQRIVTDANKQPYFLVDTFVVDLKLLVLSPGKIETVNVLKDSNAVAAYGEKARHGAVIIKTKPNTKLFRVGDILEKYGIAQADRNLRVCINKTLIDRPQLILIEESEMLGVEITTDKNWINPEEANSKERVINIRTTRLDKNAF